MLSLTSIWPPFVIMASLLALATLLGRYSTFYRQLLDKTEGRYVALDGLRGYLAFGVFFTHAVTYYLFYRGGGWIWAPSRFYVHAGQIPVVLFFMITGFLFWSKAIKGNVRALSLYKGRIWRIMPLYVLLVLLVLGVVAMESRFQLKLPVGQVGGEILGLTIPGWNPGGSINDVNIKPLVTPTWTLLWELSFYALLPLMAIGAKGKRFIVLTLVVAALVPVRRYLHIDFRLVLIFWLGMLAAYVVDRVPQWPRREVVLFGIAVSAISCVVVLFPDAYAIGPYLLLFPASL